MSVFSDMPYCEFRFGTSVLEVSFLAWNLKRGMSDFFGHALLRVPLRDFRL